MTNPDTTIRDFCAALLADAEHAPPGPWEWSDCFDPDHESCGLLQVRVPSKAAWDRDGWQYITIGDMEWVEREEMALARIIARCDSQTITAMARVIEAAERMPSFDADAGEAMPEWIIVLADSLAALRDHLRGGDDG